jgi:hypothetical protein
MVMSHTFGLDSRIPCLRGSRLLTRSASPFTITPELQNQTIRYNLLAQFTVKSAAALVNDFAACAPWQRMVCFTQQRTSRLNRTSLNRTPTVNHRISNPPGEGAA